jgi:hypothetical protein
MTKEEFNKLAREEAEKYADFMWPLTVKSYQENNDNAKEDWFDGASFGFDQGVAAALEMLKIEIRDSHMAGMDKYGDAPHREDLVNYILHDRVKAKLAEREGGAKDE